jgi:alkylresorcinol/alkylpyrone synthase
MRTRNSGIAAVGRALPRHYYDQEALLAAFENEWAGRLFNPRRLPQLHRNVLVRGRHLALPIEEYRSLDSFTAANEAFIRCGLDLGAEAMTDGLERAGLAPSDVDHLFFVSVTGIATPSIDALLVNRLGLRADLKRTPIFGLGCVGGAAGVARAADYLRAFPDQVAVLLSVELCSLTLQRGDISIANLIASGLFGDGAAAVVMVGPEHPTGIGAAGPEVVATRSIFYPDTQDVMGWKIGSDGFRVVLSADVPSVVRAHVRENVDAFLSDCGLALDDISSWVAHPGGPRVLEAFAEALELPQEAVARTWESLAELGNLSSASVLMVLRDVMGNGRPPEGDWGLMVGMGPGFCSELVLLRW